jgi:hypothetical protein
MTLLTFLENGCVHPTLGERVALYTQYGVALFAQLQENRCLYSTSLLENSCSVHQTQGKRWLCTTGNNGGSLQ